MDNLNKIDLSQFDIKYILFFCTTIIAFLSWITKSAIEKPIIESKATFHNIVNKRIEFLSEVKTLLSFIAFFPTGTESFEYKEKLQSLLLRNGDTAYLDNQLFNCVLKISITPHTDEKLLLNSIKTISIDLNKQISKLNDELTFYIKFSNFHPFKRLFGLFILAVQFLMSLFLIILFITFIIYSIIFWSWGIKIIIAIVLLIAYLLATKYLEK